MSSLLASVKMFKIFICIALNCNLTSSTPPSLLRFWSSLAASLACFDRFLLISTYYTFNLYSVNFYIILLPLLFGFNRYFSYVSPSRNPPHSIRGPRQEQPQQISLAPSASSRGVMHKGEIIPEDARGPEDVLA